MLSRISSPALLWALTFLIGLPNGPAYAAVDRCADLMPPAAIAAHPTRLITPEDMVRLRDIGMPGDSIPDQSPFSLSPDGRQVAFLLRRADPAANSYCQGLFVMAVQPGARPRLVDTGGALIPYVIDDLRGMVFPTGVPAIITPHWSPDGRWIAYLKREQGITQVWRVRADGSDSYAVTASQVDVEALAWSSDGAKLLFASRPGLAREQRQIEEEGKSGFLYDRRFMPMAGSRPFPPGPVARAYYAIDVASGMVRPATAAEQARIDPTLDPERPAHALRIAIGQSGRRAWTVPHDPSLYQSSTRIWAEIPGQKPVPCRDPACDDRIAGLWWSADGHALYYLRREGWANSDYAFYRWTPGAGRPGRPRKLFTTQYMLTNCQTAGHALLCDRDASTEPRRLVLLDPKTGRSRTLFDPNPEFAAIRLGRVQRLHWRNDRGVESYGDLALPPDHRPGERHPLIVVQYRTKGFLRGGVGDEYPIQSFAARGYAVLSFERPPRLAESLAARGDPRSWEEFERENLKGWADRRNVLSSLLSGIRQVVGLGVADPAKIGLTGMSEGAMSAWFALNNSDVFAAAALSTCCMDPKSLMAVGGEAWAAQLQQAGYPPFTQENPAFWKPMSLAMNVDHVRAPILMQLPDDEYPAALETYTTFREKHRAVEMYVFPGEHHVKWQPAHRLAIYIRNLDWFDYWLKGKKDADPAKRAQYARWDALRRDQRCAGQSKAPCSPASAP